MPASFSRKRAALGLFSFFLLTASFGGFLSWGPRSAQSAANGILYRNSLDAVDVVRRLPQAVNDIIYNPADQKFYVSRPGSEGEEGNAVSKIDPISAQTLSTVFIGSEPTRLALSDDGHSMYVALDGAYGIRRYDTVTETAGLQWSLGFWDSSYQYPYTASDIAVVPGNPNRLAVARFVNGISPPGGGVAIFDNGTRLPLVGPGHSAGANYLAFASSTVLYGGGVYDGLRTMTVSDSGVVDSGTNTAFSVNRLKLDGGKVFASGGQVVDPLTRTLLGTFANASSSAFVPDAAVGRAYYARRETTNTVTVKAFDINTFVQIGTLAIPDVTSDPVAMIRYGTNGLAMVTSDKKLFLIQTSLIPTNDPLPVPSPTPTVTPTPTPSPFPTFMRQVNLAARDIVYDSAIQKLLVSVPSSDPAGNSIVELDPLTGNIDNRSFIGSDPNRLALSDDGQALFVGLDGAGWVRKYDVATRLPGQQFYLGNSYDGPNKAFDLAVLPGTTDTVAVSLNYYTSSVALYDSGVRRPATANTGGYIEFRSPTELVTLTGRYAVSQNGLTLINTLSSGTSSDFRIYDGRLYLANGRVVDLNTQSIVGSFSGLGYSSSIFVDGPNNRAYYLTNSSSGSGYSIRAYELDTYRFMGAVTLPYFSNTPTGFVRWGSNGFAFRDDYGRVYLLQTSLTGSADPIPTPTPTVSPTPTPSPANAPTFVRQIDLPANDLVYSSSNGSLYASVPSIAGVGRGNTLTRIDPATGTLGDSVFVGSEPSRMAISDNGQTIYSRLDGANGAVRRFDVPGGTAGLQFQAPLNLQDMKVMPGHPDTVAFASGVSGGVSLFDNGVQRPVTSNGNAYGIYSIDFSDENTLWGYDNYSSGFELVKFTPTANGVSPTNIGSNIISGYGVQIRAVGNYLFSTSGRIVETTSASLVGTLAGSGSTMAIDTQAGRVFFLNNNVLSAYDAVTMLKIGQYTLPSFSGSPASLVRWGENGLAFRTTNSIYGGGTDSRVYVLQSSLVSPSAPLPTGISMSTSLINTSEYSSTQIVTITRSGDLSRASTVDYKTADGTAKAGQDYTAQSGTLTFAAGEASKTVSIPIINDTIYEGPESFSFVLSNVTGTGSELLSPSTTTLNISDNDPQPSISTTAISANEPPNGSTSTATFTVRLSNPSIQAVSVNYATANGTATAGSDYIAASGTLTFAPLETQKTVTVQILGDTNGNEPSETFFLVFSGPVNGSVYTTQYTGTIINYFPSKTFADFDGDKKADIGIYRPNAGEWWISKSADSSVFATQFGTSSDMVSFADFTGDGRTDLAFFRPSTGLWYVLRSEDLTYYAFAFGSSGDIPTPADFDGDGKADPAVFRPSEGTWYIARSSDSATAIIQFGAAGDQPVAKDYDGDGKADIAVWRPNGPSGGEWWIQRSTAGLFATQFGMSSDNAVPGDFTGDGKADIAFFRPSTGTWYVLRSEDSSYSAFPFGQAGDIPAPGDFDGDGKFDAVVFRPSEANWYINRSGSGPLIVQFGATGDKPLTNAYVR